MLQKLNERFQGVVAWIVVILIAITFTLFGVDSYLQSRQSSTNVAVEVNGVPISKEAFNLKYDRMRQALEARGIMALDKQYKQQLLNELVLHQVSLQSAAQYGFNVSIGQADQAILQIPEFQEKGQFSSTRYQQVLSSALFTHETFQRDVREGMLLNQQRFAFIGTAFALPNEIDAYVKLNNQVRDYRYLMIPSDLFLSTATASSEEVATYFKQHAQDFLKSEEVSLQYVRLSMADVKANIHLSPEELNRFYEDNKNNYVDKKGATQAFVKVKDAVAQQLLAERAQAEYARVLEELSDLSYQTPDELSSVATKLGLSLQKTPLFARDGGKSSLTKNPQVLQAAFSRDVLVLGNNSSPLQLDNETVVVVRVAEHVPAKEKALQEVKAAIDKKVREEKAQAQAMKLGDEIWHAKDNALREQLIKKHQLTWKTVTLAKRDESKAPLSVNALAFSLQHHETDAIIGSHLNDGLGYVVVELQKVVDGDLASVDKDQLKGIIEQIETNDGTLDYDLYIKQLMNHAKVVRN